jgi:hypothetical protein
MEKVLVLVEGQTEERFVFDVLDPHLQTFSRCAVPKVLVTKRPRAGRPQTGGQFKGGVLSYAQVKGDLGRLLTDTSATIVTTMLDYYAIPQDFPGFATQPKGSDPYASVRHLEAELAKDMGDRRFVPYLCLHEFEALIFTDPAQCKWIFGASAAKVLTSVRDAFPTPEHIDDDPKTAPSKRILQEFPEYEKPVHGNLAILDIGLDAVRAACRHFDAWVSRLER